ncbi:serine hydrolase domain-containing protein [Neobacillus cucumis]|uniref:serine hydrolase domain-containing protein n=1 Tax=Neobacillus cucumis TaxID=1740721 RepID=UPI0019649EAB|nr:serine hydrolase domain-containing protein [Neobacillus cucumis]MBM7654988.1 CubicO group peptidase (beta-lactamase class C family) [Neobacillus cucumis]
MNCKNLWLLFITLLIVCTLGGCGGSNIDKNITITKKPVKVAKINNKLKKESQKESKIRQEVKNYLQKNKLSGSVAIVRGNHILFNEGVGYADIDKKVLNQPSTTFPIGSITKSFVATSIMKLQEQGKLNIQDPISKYIPTFPDGKNINLYHFLTHTSGIQRLRWHPGDTTPLKLIQEIEKMGLKYPPGSRWDYLDTNYIVLGYVLEKVTGMDLNNFIQTNIFDKVPMKDSGFITPDHPVSYTSVGYLLNGDNYTPTKYLNTYALFGCGSIYSTALDVAQYDQALMNGRLTSKAILKQIITPSSKSTYGLGLYNDITNVYSVGVLGGWYTMHAYYPTDKTSIVVLLNERGNSINIKSIVSDIHQITVSSHH